MTMMYRPISKYMYILGHVQNTVWTAPTAFLQWNVRSSNSYNN